MPGIDRVFPPGKPSASFVYAYLHLGIGSRRPVDRIDMMAPLDILTKIVKYTIAVAAILATASGCVRAVEFGITVFGIVPMALAGAFALGCIVTAAVLLSRRA